MPCDRPDVLASHAKIKLETLKYRGDLRLEYLKRIYDRSPVFHRYLTSEACIHLHGLWYTHTGIGKQKEMLGACIRIKRTTMESGPVARPQKDAISMLVGVGESLEK